MGFGDLTKEAGIKALDEYLLNKSYIEGYQPSKADNVVFEALGKEPVDTYVCASRWYKHIKSFGDQRKKFPGQAKDISSYGPSAPAEAAAPKDEDDDDIDFFGSEDEEEAEKRRAERVAAYNERKKDKKKETAKSIIILDIKPWDDETDMKAMEEAVRSIAADGLVWGTSKFVPVVHGIKKLQITCVIEDDKIDTQFLEDEISKFDDYVQSIDIAAFNKL
uniref:Elongation factor 1-beta n=1 Tax=Schistocephalus solidus TaxID=70667 RepID=A0A0X3Q4D7_SCHSO